MEVEKNSIGQLATTDTILKFAVIKILLFIGDFLILSLSLCPRLMVVALQEKVAAFDACTMNNLFCILSECQYIIL